MHALVFPCSTSLLRVSGIKLRDPVWGDSLWHSNWECNWECIIQSGIVIAIRIHAHQIFMLNQIQKFHFFLKTLWTLWKTQIIMFILHSEKKCFLDLYWTYLANNVPLGHSDSVLNRRYTIGIYWFSNESLWHSGPGCP